MLTTRIPHRAWSLLLIAALILGALPLAAHAQDDSASAPYLFYFDNTIPAWVIERTLLELPGVSDAVVLTQSQRDSRHRVIRAVLETRDERLAPAEVRAWCLQRLSEYKVPRQIDLVDRLPRTPRGKVDRRALSESRDAVPLT